MVGNMDQKTFVNIFTPFVGEETRYVPDDNHAVFIRDGHISRFALPSLYLLNPAKRQRVNRDSCTISQIVDETAEDSEARAAQTVYEEWKLSTHC